MNNTKITVHAITMAGALVAAASAGTGWSREGDDLYRTTNVEAAAASTAWGNETGKVNVTEVIHIDPPLKGVDRTDDKVTVFDLYQYGAFSNRRGRKDWKVQADELVARWKEGLPEGVDVVRLPIVNLDRRSTGERDVRERNHQKMVMTAMVLGIEDAISERLIEALDDNRNAAATEAEAKSWLREAGAEKDAIDSAWESDAVGELITQAKWLHTTMVLGSRSLRDREFRYEPPMLAVDNRFIVARHNTTRASRAFEIANTVIAAELADQREPSEEDLRWRALYDEMRTSYKQDGHWDNKREPAKEEVFVLEPPLKTVRDGRTEVEWFYTYVNRGWYDAKHYTGWLAIRIGSMMDSWMANAPEILLKRIRVRLSPVGSIAGETPDLDEHHRIHQRMVLGFGYVDEWGIAPEADRALGDAFAYYAPALTMAKVKNREKAMRRGGISVRGFRRAWRRGIAGDRADTIDARFAELNRQLGLRAPHWLDGPRHPIVVVDGKYVIQGSTSGGMVAAIQTFNWVLMKAIADKSRS